MKKKGRTPKIKAPKKLIEVALPLDVINKASAREKSIRHGHPSTLHLWWARRPLAAARAVLFAQLVNDPGGERGWGKYKGQTKEDAAKERQRLFRLIEQLVQWENTNNEEVLDQAREEIRKSWRETCELNKGLPGFDPEKLPPFHDPFAGGGTIPLEAQRLGLEAHASDLNPVAVLINKAMIEIPPKFAGRPPVGPVPKGEKQKRSKVTEDWSGTKGLAEDVRRYGAWMREEAFKKIGHLYPPVKITKKMANGRSDLEPYIGQERTVIAWLWCRTVPSPNPAMGGTQVPLISSYWLSKKKGKEAYLEPVVKGKKWHFAVRRGQPGSPAKTGKGTKIGRGKFKCLLSGTAIPSDYIRAQGMKGGLSNRMTAIVISGKNERLYVEFVPEHVECADSIPTYSGLKTDLPKRALGFRVQNYGLLKHGDLFTDRQQNNLMTLSALIAPAARRIEKDAGDDRHYGVAVATYLALATSKAADYNSNLCSWSTSRGQAAHVFTRQALPMVWDFPEVNPFAEAAGDVLVSAKGIAKAIENLPLSPIQGEALQCDAREIPSLIGRIVSTDPPYFDNIGYANLSDFFYIWLRRALKGIAPELVSTILTPKEPELIASSSLHDNKAESEDYFLTSMTRVMHGFSMTGGMGFPVTIYYAFKQSEKHEDGEASTGWETFIGAVLASGLALTGTWPTRSERAERMRSLASNALASAIVLVCRPRPEDAPSVSRRQFLRELRQELPLALELMISGAKGQSPVAPVDLQQAAIGPGMAIFSKYKEVLEADGSPMPVRQALIHINRAIDDYFSEAEGDLDIDTRFCVTWFEQHAFANGKFGEADVLARAKGTSVEGVVEAGVVQSGRGNVRLLQVSEYPADWDPREDKRVPTWEALHHLCRTLDDSEAEAGKLLAAMPHMQEPVRQLAYRLHIFCERKGWADDALRYNTLMTSWSAIVEHSLRAGHVGEQLNLA